MATFRLVDDDGALDAARADGTAYVAVVSDRASAEEAVLAAVGGRDLVLRCTAPDEVVDNLLDDLARLGDVVYDSGALSPVERDLLVLLRDGHSLGDAARSLHVSRRTADRRLAHARAVLGVLTTPEAVIAAGRQGLL